MWAKNERYAVLTQTMWKNRMKQKLRPIMIMNREKMLDEDETTAAENNFTQGREMKPEKIKSNKKTGVFCYFLSRLK